MGFDEFWNNQKAFKDALAGAKNQITADGVREICSIAYAAGMQDMAMRVNKNIFESVQVLTPRPAVEGT